MFGNAVVAGQDMLMLTQSEVAFGGLGNPLGKWSRLEELLKCAAPTEEVRESEKTRHCFGRGA